MNQIIDGREFNFRAWVGNGFYYWSLPEKPDGHLTTHQVIKNGVPIQQSTGLFDANGREIYEGDIVQQDDEIAEVFFEAGKFQIQPGYDAYDLWNWVNEYRLRLVVVGNKFQNPELLECNGEGGKGTFVAHP